MPGMPVTRTQFPALMARGLKVLFDENIKDLKDEFSDLYNIETSTAAYETELGLVGLGLPGYNAELELPKMDSPKQGRPVTYVHSQFALGTAISFLAKKDDQYGKLANMMVPMLTDSFKVYRNTWGASILNNAFTLQGYEPDKTPLVNGAHPLVSSALTVSNLVTVPLSIAGLQQARALLRKTLTESGKIKPMVGTTLIVPPSLESLAEELVKSTMKVGQTLNAAGTLATQPNEVNLPFVRGLRVVVMNYLKDNGQWFLTVDKSDHRLKWFEREKVYSDEVIDYKAQAIEQIARARWSVGFSDWRGIVGYPGM